MKNKLLLTAAAVFVALGTISSAEAMHGKRHMKARMMGSSMDASGTIAAGSVDRERVCCEHSSSCRMDLYYKYH